MKLPTLKPLFEIIKIEMMNDDSVYFITNPITLMNGHCS